MLANLNTNIERLIGKIDNDFNPDNSDWIPRVGAWAIDAMQQLNVLRKVTKQKTIKVIDRIAYVNCPINNTEIKVFDCNGCEIKQASKAKSCKCAPSTGEKVESNTEISNTLNYYQTTSPNNVPDITLAESQESKDFPNRYRIHEINVHGNDARNYVIVDCNKLELNFDTNSVTIEYKDIETIDSEAFGCCLPVIPNNGLLLEAIAFYCMYKMLTRGYKHPVFNLGASQYGTNPYYIWNQLKEEAKRSVAIQNQGDIDTHSFRSAFFIETFDPRR